MENQNIVKGIICNHCGNELPEMTIEQHLNGGFVQDCPHINPNFYIMKDYLIDIMDKMLKSDFKKYKSIQIEELDGPKIYLSFDKKTKTYDKIINLLDELDVHYKLNYIKFPVKLWGEPSQCYQITITTL